MEIKIISDEKNELEFEIDNQTIAELLRVYLNQDSNVKLGAWKKEHYSKPLKIKIITEGKTPKKALQDAIGKVQKELTSYKNEFTKAK